MRIRGVAARMAAGATVATLAATLVATGAIAPSPGAPARPRMEGRTSIVRRGPVPAGTMASLHTDIPTEMVGMSWDGPPDAELEVRTREATGAWSAWQAAATDDDIGPDATSKEFRRQSTAGPVWIGENRREIQVRVNQGVVANLRVHTIHSPQAATPAGWSVPGASAEPAPPAIISRAQWGADESFRTFAPGCDGTVSYASTVRNAIVHHTDNTNNYSPDQTASIIRGIYYFHTHTNQWCDIGYNFLVDRFGRVWEGRYGGITKAVVGAHAGGYNTGSTGVSLIGEFGSAPVPAAMYNALRSLLAWKFGYHGIDAGGQVAVVAGAFPASKFPEGSTVVLPTISGHRDVDQTSCPGQFAYGLLPQLRRDVQHDVMTAPAFPFGGWTPTPGGAGVLTLDGYGDLHPAGSQPAVEPGAFWPGWAIARGATREATGGYVLDGWGGLHPYGGAPDRTAGLYLSGWDIMRGLARGPVADSGWALDGWGGLHPFGGAPLVQAAYWPGWDIARGVATGGARAGGYTVDGWGGVHPFGAAPPRTGSASWPGWDIARGIAVRPDGVSGYVLDGFGGLHPFGGAPALTVFHYTAGSDEARGITLNEKGTGGWVVDTVGRLWPVGDEPQVAPSLTWGGLNLGRAVVAAPSTTPATTP
ncbi:MAG: hypothetical protein JWO37_2412 [Acidimicrobiales bacterium]|nr:hypothetical protein [Acidimicrobiales bacterium]